MANGSMPDTLEKGADIKVGTKIGTMGGTGGRDPKAKDKFVAHLHLMVYTGALSQNPIGYSDKSQQKTFGPPLDSFKSSDRTFYDPMKFINSGGQIVKCK